MDDLQQSNNSATAATADFADHGVALEQTVPSKQAVRRKKNREVDGLIADAILWSSPPVTSAAHDNETVPETKQRKQTSATTSRKRKQTSTQQEEQCKKSKIPKKQNTEEWKELCQQQMRQTEAATTFAQALETKLDAVATAHQAQMLQVTQQMQHMRTQLEHLMGCAASAQKFMDGTKVLHEQCIALMEQLMIKAQGIEQLALTINANVTKAETATATAAPNTQDNKALEVIHEVMQSILTLLRITSNKVNELCHRERMEFINRDSDIDDMQRQLKFLLSTTPHEPQRK